ncbi:cytochrome P450 [Cylindrobasidium torrendii FP15055 ss-10]|uniref:Cytochrome P450 n=1 Tax=Cylindrobasidium torrendii FP15055 ss-10 TaxID=1314674 RepID=A0A0D7BVJ8_9AGAR|nr:cytochrome P450 [Cylindrobasidium torrendii FP15055 ss-10]
MIENAALLTAFIKIACLIASFLVLNGTWTLYRNYTSPLWRLKGPARGNFFWGNQKEKTIPEWLNEYGRVLTHASFLRRPRLLLSDTKAVSHIVSHATVYPKDENLRYILGQLVGNGMIVAEGDEHKRQRRVMNPAFGNAHIKELIPIFFEKALQLRDTLNVQCANSDVGYRTNAIDWMTKTTLDIIGIAGFGYDFHALDTAQAGKSDLQLAFDAVGSAAAGRFRMVQAMIPIFRLIPTQNAAALRSAQKNMDSIGSSLLSEAKQMVALGEKVTNAGKDLFSLLVRANTATDLPAHQKLSDKDVVTQVPTFFVAGHETTASSLVWMMYALTRAPHVQEKLRQELLSVPTDTLSFDDLSALPYLDAVMREALRLHAPVIFTERVATKDDILPLSEPIEDRYGNILDSIRVQPGDLILVSNLGINTDPAIWGPDAHEFKPERWMVPRAGVTVSIPGVWSNIMSFWGGARGCIGFRFSILEAKAIAFTLYRSFKFELAVKHEELTSHHFVVQRPYLEKDIAAGPQLPIIVKPIV